MRRNSSPAGYLWRKRRFGKPGGATRRAAAAVPPEHYVDRISRWVRVHAMEPSPRSSIPGSQRTLAAILFTDVVGFSARMQRAEVRTLELLQKDFALMRQLCAEHEG